MSTMLTIATINVANLGEWSESERLHNFARSIVEDLNSPLVIAVQEMGGTLQGEEEFVHSAVAQQILTILLNDFQQSYCYGEIPPRPETTGGADNINIRCGFFYRSNIVVKSLALLGEGVDVFVGDESQAFVASRLPLMGQFCYGDHEFYVINCHLKSMSLKNQTKKQAKKQRNKQSEYIANYIAEHQLLEQPLCVVGDMNDTFSSKTVQNIAHLGFKSAHQLLKYQIYTYKYQKKPILLDYILYNELFENIDSQVIHINTDQMSGRSYSDHDPLMMLCQICKD